MSRIIKPHEIILQEPVVIEVRNEEIPHEVPPTEIELGDAQAEVRAEADRIIRETEDIVLEILDKARLEAQNIIDGAQDEARETRLMAEKEAEMIKEKSAENGYLEGWDKAKEESRDKIEEARQQSEDLLEQAYRERLGIIGSCENIIVRMSIDIAKKIVEKELTTNPDIIIKLVKNIVGSMNTAEAYKILVNPEDFETLTAEFGKQNLYSSVNDKIQILADENVSPGGCVAETDIGSVDATLETRVASLEDAIMGVVNHE